MINNKIENRLKELGITLPQPKPAIASYVPFIIQGNLIFISGQLPLGIDSENHIGKLGENISLEQSIKSARACAINIIAQLKQGINNLDNIDRCIKLTVFVNSTNSFMDQPKVANGASNLLIEIFGDAGKHARAAVGVSQLPLGVCVEVDAIFSFKN